MFHPLLTRRCGDCTVCCTVLAIRELDKPEDTPCKHLCKGCGIYAQRPQVCRTYACGWLSGFGDEEHRPDKLGLLLSPFDNREGTGLDWLEWSFVAREVRFGAAYTHAALQYLTKIASMGFLVFLVHGPDRGKVFGPEELVIASRRWCTEHGYKNMFALLAKAQT